MPTADQLRWLQRPLPCGCKHSNPWACYDLQRLAPKYSRLWNQPDQDDGARSCDCACHRPPRED